MTTTDASSAKRATLLWAAAFFVAMFGTPMVLSVTHVLSGPWATAVMILPMLLLIPMVRATERMQRVTGCASTVARRYNRRMLGASFAYVIGLGAGLLLLRGQDVAKPVAALLALLPTLPVFAMIWAMARYVIEEKDEYLRARTVNAALIATGLLLATATFWGFLTTFEVAPDVPAWAAVPVWCIGLGFGQLVNRVRGA
ncbi:hypothetical protein CVO77_04600 [Sphingopyxis lindanitolerans]|uniref:Uncharacterized protein n=1 Tax=Sphingopyxis lindanitolerans TaxID=2054227 RepID=A0A2S8B6G0_9SPHN|nr:hypothetical protein [Sphingopyxis lindanitolerans]PQM27839.1 hypothetical protein CVO77_04600 [Sphingopyxis lindanitolerans]